MEAWRKSVNKRLVSVKSKLMFVYFTPLLQPKTWFPVDVEHSVLFFNPAPFTTKLHTLTPASIQFQNLKTTHHPDKLRHSNDWGIIKLKHKMSK